MTILLAKSNVEKKLNWIMEKLVHTFVNNCGNEDLKCSYINPVCMETCFIKGVHSSCDKICF